MELEQNIKNVISVTIYACIMKCVFHLYFEYHNLNYIQAQIHIFGAFNYLHFILFILYLVSHL